MVTQIRQKHEIGCDTPGESKDDIHWILSYRSGILKRFGSWFGLLYTFTDCYYG